MKKSLFVIGVAVMVLMFASCDNAVSVDVYRPGNPRNVTIREVSFAPWYGETPQRWALVEWDAGSNSGEAFAVYRRVDNGQPNFVYPQQVTRGVWTVRETGTGTAVSRDWEQRSGPTTERWSARFRLDMEQYTMWQGANQIGIIAWYRPGVASCYSAASGISWAGETVNFTNQPGSINR